MAGPCAKCRHFRRVRPASQLLAAAFGSKVAAEGVAAALSKIVEDEQKLWEAESNVKSTEGIADRENWMTRPMMSDYCGLEEENETYLIAEVKNRDEGCVDFSQEEIQRHACSDCQHRTGATGREHDQAIEDTYIEMINSSVAVQASTQSPEALLQAQRAGSEARKALELSGAYASKGRMLSEPEYLDYCAHFSTEDEFVICVLKNTHNTCAAWVRTADALRGKPPDEPGTPVGTERATAMWKGGEMEDAILAEGPPPLALAAADCAIDVVDFMAAVVRGVDAIDVTPEVRASWRSYLTSYYPMLNPADRYFFATAHHALAAINAGWPQMSESDRQACRQSWAQVLPALLQFIEPVLRPAARAQASAAAFGPPAGVGYGSPVPASQEAFGQDSVGSLMNQIQNQQRMEEQEALEKGGVALQQQVRMNNDAVNIQMLSNMAAMRHQAMMAVANNMKY
jgi:hypothetical protein